MVRAPVIAGINAAFLLVLAPSALAEALCAGAAMEVEPAFPITERQCAHLAALRAAEQHGLDPADYDLDELEVLAAHAPAGSGQRLSEQLERSYSRFAVDVAYGRVEPGLADPEWHIPNPRRDAVVAESPDSGILSTDELNPPYPPHPEYARLREAMIDYLSILADGGWPQVPAGPNLMVGMRDARVELVRDRLRTTGDFDTDMEADPWFFGAGLDAAVREFQARHGLKVDGIVGGDTREMMSVPVEVRIEQLGIAMERWRWLPRDLGEQYAWVNAAELTLKVMMGEEPVLLSRAIVGHSSRPTPSLQSEIRQLVFNPTWSVPPTIATEDLLPKVQRDPDFLSRGGYRVFTGWGAETREIDPATVDWAAQRADQLRYRFVQSPGPNNSLGRVKIVFNNPYDIYLHDTPAKSLFTLRTRMFSSGCVRVEEANEFADYLLAHYSSASDLTMEQILASPKTQAIDLETRIPIYVVYITAWVAEDGQVNFRRDLYGRDATVVEAIHRVDRAADGLLTHR